MVSGDYCTGKRSKGRGFWGCLAGWFFFFLNWWIWVMVLAGKWRKEVGFLWWGNGWRRRAKMGLFVGGFGDFRWWFGMVWKLVGEGTGLKAVFSQLFGGFGVGLVTIWRWCSSMEGCTLIVLRQWHGELKKIEIFKVVLWFLAAEKIGEWRLFQARFWPEERGIVGCCLLKKMKRKIIGGFGFVEKCSGEGGDRKIWALKNFLCT